MLSRQFAAGDIDHFTVEKWFLHKDGGYLWADLTGLIQKLGGQVIVRACGRAGVRAWGRAGVGRAGVGRAAAWHAGGSPSTTSAPGARRSASSRRRCTW